jgi:hypothetical protein
MIAACLFPASVVFVAFPAASADVLQCVPYARELSGVNIRGDAWTWWDQAKGRYARGRDPRPGAVIALANSEAMPLGHVAVVSRVVDDRRILLRHANWSAPGLIEQDVLAVDTSEDNDWSQVRVWWGKEQKLGARNNPVNGFIYPARTNSVALAKAEPQGDAAQGRTGAEVRPARAPRLTLDLAALRAVRDTGVTMTRSRNRTLDDIMVDVKRLASAR